MKKYNEANLTHSIGWIPLYWSPSWHWMSSVLVGFCRVSLNKCQSDKNMSTLWLFTLWFGITSLEFPCVGKTHEVYILTLLQFFHPSPIHSISYVLIPFSWRSQHKLRCLLMFRNYLHSYLICPFHKWMKYSDNAKKQKIVIVPSDYTWVNIISTPAQTSGIK